MAIGPKLRAMLPDGIEHTAARMYRRVFVDLEKVAQAMARALPERATVLDIGGGDGALLNHLLRLRADVRVDMVDIAPQVGRHLQPEFTARVRFFPARRLELHQRPEQGGYDAAMVADVMHHIPPGERVGFLSALKDALSPEAIILIKDVEPGHPIAWLGLYCDRYLSGDRGTELVSMASLTELLQRVWPAHSTCEQGLLSVNRPNYLLCASPLDARAAAAP